MNTHTVSRVHVVRGRYDAAQTTDENRRLWALTDGYDADTCNNLAVRVILRNRARYVFANNPRARGIIRTLANHTVGATGPRLQMQIGTGKQARQMSSRIEASFQDWSKETKLAKKLRILRIAKVISGEIFPIQTLNPKVFHPVKLDLKLVEADQVHNPVPGFNSYDADGVFFDEFGNADRYRVLKFHPGGRFYTLGINDYDDISANFCLHYFGQDRPNQHRGIPEITPAVQVFEEGRRFRSAVLGAAETAADFAMALETDASADVEGAEASAGTTDSTFRTFSPMDQVELTRRMATVLPKGFKLTQTKAEQPTTTYKEFMRELLCEIARCLDMPLSIATLDANDANMSSSYVINQPYEKAIDVERGDIETDILEPLFDQWLTLAFDPMGEPMARRMPNEFPHTWSWPLIGEHADPAKVASAEDTRLANRSTTLAAIFARRNLDWEVELEQRARELQRAKELEGQYGLDPGALSAPPNVPPPPPDQQTGDPNAQDNQTVGQ